MIGWKAPSWEFMDSPFSESGSTIDGEDMITDQRAKIRT